MSEHNYLKKLARTLKPRDVRPGNVVVVQAFHDDWCGVFKGGRCNCEPDIEKHVLRRPGGDGGNGGPR